MQREIERPLNTFINKIGKEIFKDETMLLIIIGQDHSISIYDKQTLNIILT